MTIFFTVLLYLILAAGLALAVATGASIYQSAPSLPGVILALVVCGTYVGLLLAMAIEAKREGALDLTGKGDQ